MLTKRIIPCLDIKDGRTVKGINFENIKALQFHLFTKTLFNDDASALYATSACTTTR